MHSLKKQLRVTTLLALLPGLIASGCGSGPDRSESEKSVTELAAGLSFEADYDRSSSPAELASDQDAHLIVEGTVDAFLEGRTYGEERAESLETFAMAVEVNTVLSGSLPKGDGGSVYVEFDATEGQNFASLNELVGTPLVAYLTELSDRGAYPSLDIDSTVSDVPSGQPIFRPYTPQGLYFHDAQRGGVLQVQEGVCFPNSSLQDFEPSNEQFPEAEQGSAD